MMNLNKKDLKIIGYEFKCISNRLLKSPFDEIQPVLNMFINHVDNIEIIHEYINSCKRDGFNIEKEAKEVINGYGRYLFRLGNTIDEEIYTVYTILKYISEDKMPLFGLIRAYDIGSQTFDESIKTFNDRVSLVLINHISDYLTKIGIRMGYDEEEKYMININGGQVNISKDNSTLNATQNIGMNTNELSTLIKEINVLLNENIPTDEKTMIQESIDTIQSELQNNQPKKGLIKSCIQGLKSTIISIPTAIELCTKLQGFIEWVGTAIQNI